MKQILSILTVVLLLGGNLFAQNTEKKMSYKDSKSLIA